MANKVDDFKLDEEGSRACAGGVIHVKSLKISCRRNNWCPEIGYIRLWTFISDTVTGHVM